MFTFKYPTIKYTETAGFTVRMAAFLIDVVATTVVLRIFSFLSVFFNFSLSDTQQLLLFSIYVVFFTWKYGRTFGKYHTHLKVENLNGEPISLVQSLLRSIFYWALVIVPYVFAYIGLGSLDYDETTGRINKSYVELFQIVITTLGSYMLICIVLLVDALCIAVRKDNRALHDLIAGTRCMKN